MNYKKLYLLLVCVLFILFSLSFLSIKLWDYDYWWHIATGRQIVVWNHIPSLDNFNFVTQHNRQLYPGLNAREPFLMKQYWLAQVAFYWIYESLGSWGIVSLRSLLLTSVMWLMFRGLRSEGVPGLFSLLLLIPSFFVLLNKYTGERPVLFTFVFALAAFLLANSVRKEGMRKIIFLPPLMLLWANLHGGFILGIVIILVFWIEETARLILKKSGLPARDYGIITAILAVSALITTINPNGWNVYLLMGDAKYDIFVNSVQEYQPLFSHYLEKASPLDPYVLGVLGIVGLVFFARIAEMRLSHIILFSGFAAMGLLHQRYFVFCSTIGVVIAGKELVLLWRFLSSKFTFLLRPSLHIAASVVAVSCMILFAGRTSYAISTKIKTWSPDYAYPAGRYATDFIRSNRIPGRMFNSHAVGGYLIWELYPWKQVFTDTRSIDIASHVEYDYITRAEPADPGKRPGWERLLDMYDINFMVVAPMGSHGIMSPLVKALLENDRWALVHFDPEYMIYVKDSERNSKVVEKHRIESKDAYWMIIYKAAHMLSSTPNPYLYATVGYCFEQLGEDEEAKKAYRGALNYRPKDKELLSSLARVSSSASSGEMSSN